MPDGGVILGQSQTQLGPRRRELGTGKRQGSLERQIDELKTNLR